MYNCKLVGVLLCMSGLAAAQSTWVVDASGGAGSHFTTIAAAVTRAVDGDSIIVRAGTYASFAVDEALTIHGEPGAIVNLEQNSSTTTIRDIAATKTLVMHGLDFTTRLVTGLPFLAVTDCPGRVIIRDVEIGSNPIGPLVALTVSSSAAVSIDNCRVQFSTEISSSNVVAVRTKFSDWIVNSIVSTDSTIQLTSCTARGGITRAGLAFPAISCSNSAIELRGAGSLYIAVRGRTTVPAVVGRNSSSLTFDDTLVAFSNPSDSGFGSRTARGMSWVMSSGGQIGGSVDVRLGGPRGQPYLLFVALPAQPIVVPGLGQLWVDTQVRALITTGMQVGVNFVDINLSVPNQMNLRGQAFTFQALAGKSAAVELSNPTSVVLH